MKFRTWIETEAGLGTLPFQNRGTDTPASAEVQRTGLQPQVNAQEINTQQKDEEDKLKAIDSNLKHIEKNLPSFNGKNPKLSQFQSLWQRFQKKWEDIKNLNSKPPEDEQQAATANPNTMNVGPQQIHGPGTFGMR